MLRVMVQLYRKLPGKPFRSLLTRAFDRYTKLYAKERVMAEVDGIRFELDLGEAIDRAIYFEGSFEPITSAVLIERAQPGMTVLDIGANIGWHTCRLARRVWPGTVIAFEPMSWARRKLMRNLQLNDLQNVVVESIALSDQNTGKSSVHFRSSWKWVPQAARSTEDPASQNPEEVEFMALDSYVKMKALSSVGLIKLDVDGYELKVLKGAAQLLAQCKPAIFLELGSYTLEEFGDNLPDLIDFLANIGYDFYDEKDTAQFPSKSALIAGVPKAATINVVCTCRPGTAHAEPREAGKAQCGDN